MRAGPSQEEVRRQNLGALLRLVNRHGAMSRAELTARLGLNRSTIGALTADLAAAGLVAEAAPRETGRAGRPSLVVSPRSETVGAYALSIEVDGVRAARVGLGGVVQDRREAPRPSGQPLAAAATQVASLVAEMQAVAPAGVQCVGSGVAVAAQARTAGGIIAPAGPPDEAAPPLRAALAAVLGGERTISIGAAADLAALAEHTRGVAAGCDHLLYLHGDVGVSAGVIADGRRVTGHDGALGDVGHMVVSRDGRACGCGSRGCWETEVGEPALLRAAGRDEGGGRVAVRAVLDAAARGDATARAALAQVGGWLGFGVGNLVNILRPEMVIFGGTLRDLYLAAAAPLRSRLNRIGPSRSRAALRLRTPRLGDEAPLAGAAELAFDALLADPLETLAP